jgi:hypothetical protein
VYDGDETLYEGLVRVGKEKSVDYDSHANITLYDYCMRPIDTRRLVEFKIK